MLREYDFKIFVSTKDNFPFAVPGLKFSCELPHLPFDVNKLEFEEIMQEGWHPSLRIVDVIEKAEAFIFPCIESGFSHPSSSSPVLWLFTKVRDSIY